MVSLQPVLAVGRALQGLLKILTSLPKSLHRRDFSLEYFIVYYFLKPPIFFFKKYDDFFSEQRSSYGHHRCVTHFIGIPLFIFYYAIDYALDWQYFLPTLFSFNFIACKFYQYTHLRISTIFLHYH
jgi:hypothetical protein